MTPLTPPPMTSSSAPTELSGWIPSSVTEILETLNDKIQEDFQSIADLLQQLAEQDANFSDYEQLTAQLILEWVTHAIANAQEAREDDRVQATIEGSWPNFEDTHADNGPSDPRL